jgi:hypothetical protein
MKIKFYTVATYENDGFRRLIQSSEYWGIDLTILGAGLEWVGHGQKINLLKAELQNLNDDDIVGFVDGFDVVFFTGEEEILDKFKELTTKQVNTESLPLIKCPSCSAVDPNTECLVDDPEGETLVVEVSTGKVVFGAEQVCAPDISLANRFPVDDSEYRFLNSGNFIGKVGELKKITAAEIADTDNDQLYYQKKFLAGKPNVFGEFDGHEYLESQESFDIILDYDGHIFQCMEAGGEKILNQEELQSNYDRVFEGDRWVYPCIRHGHDKVL